jgi:glycosyltransferase involved in cell wall biosynthesis
MFDHAWVNEALNTHDDPAAVVQRAYRAIKPGGRLAVTVSFGRRHNSQTPSAFYLASTRRLLEPLFEIDELRHLDGYVVVAGQRRERPTGVPVLRLDADEVAFYELERRQSSRTEQATADLVAVIAQRGKLTARAGSLQADLDLVRRELSALRQRVAQIKRWLALPLAVLRLVRRVKQMAGRTSAAHADPPPRVDVPTKRNLEGETATAPPLTWQDVLRSKFDSWLVDAKAASGEEVVLMFSGTTFVQEHRGNRPIRLTNVYLSRRDPVFFNYYRWSNKEPLPDHPDNLLFQSPIDATPSLIDRVLTADFGSKRKLLFASFPHELMVRYLTVAAQHGWVTIYDARDDWAEFAKVGMAKWYQVGYERYVASHADVTTAVSSPLARKVSALAGRAVHVVPNGLDPRFPRAGGRSGKKSREPVVGYFGHLTDKWFDWPLVIEAARRYPDYKFELAGHQEPNLDLPPNVQLLGLLSHRALAEKSRRWGVAIIPFKNSPLADAVDPIKIYEYLHLGLPVLTTYLPQCRLYPGTTVTEGPEEFFTCLATIMDTKPPEAVEDWLARNTWECRVDAYSNLAAESQQHGRNGVMALLDAGGAE